jgi:hypothetical protein
MSRIYSLTVIIFLLCFVLLRGLLRPQAITKRHNRAIGAPQAPGSDGADRRGWRHQIENVGVGLDIAYEYQKIRYENKWAANMSIDMEVIQNIIASVSYALPWMRTGM